ncbi:LexA family transcriptional regulator [uncultured Acidaminococcus sp.]|uniref:LexA family protein n=1 Tax=uncultured Acidaminococcus sp. TaxID=352152 RepID=UPI002594AB40|nr:S24 family peptidase [uncultured Acidaminococcus sp.]
MKPVKDIIKSKRLELGMTMKELAEKVGVSEGTISRWESGEIANMRRNVIVSLAKALNTTPAVLMGWTEPDSNEARGVRIPVLGRVVAGIPIEAITDIIDYEEIPAQMAKGGTYFALQVKGRSMEPTLHEGDVVIVRQQPEVENGEIAIVLINGDEATVKEVKESPEGLTLIGHNVGVYSPHFYTREQIRDLPIRIIGKVVELRRKF